MFHAAGAQVCSVAVSTLAETGGSGLETLLALAALFISCAFVIALVMRARRRREASRISGGVPPRSGSAAALVLLAAVAMTAAALGTPPPAIAAGPDDPAVQYSDGCALFGVDAQLSTAAAAMLPGDEAVAVTATVTNRFDGPITITVAPSIKAGSGIDSSDLVLTTLIDGTATNMATLSVGGQVVIEVRAAIPIGASSSIQGLTADLVVAISGVES